MFGIEKHQPLNVEPYIRISGREGFCAHKQIAVAICQNYVALVKLCIPIPCTGVEYDLLQSFHGFRLNLNALAFQCGALYAYISLGWLLRTYTYSCCHLQ